MEEGGEGGGERGRVAEVTKDPEVTTLQHFVGAETEKSQATPAQKSQVTPDRSHKRPLYPCFTTTIALQRDVRGSLAFAVVVLPCSTKPLDTFRQVVLQNKSLLQKAPALC